LPNVPDPFYLAKRHDGGDSICWSDLMQQDLQLRAAARAIYDACYPTEDWAPVGFDEAERYGTVHYRQAVGAAEQARAALGDRGEQLALPMLA
jgi:hypothetical protein